MILYLKCHIAVSVHRHHPPCMWPCQELECQRIDLVSTFRQKNPTQKKKSQYSPKGEQQSESVDGEMAIELQQRESMNGETAIELQQGESVDGET